MADTIAPPPCIPCAREDGCPLRQFKVPTNINFDAIATTYTELIDFNSLDKEMITEKHVK